MRRLALATALILVLCGTSSAGPDKSAEARPAKARLIDVIKTAFGLRRQGKLAAAGLAFEEVFGRLSAKSIYRPEIAQELAQLYIVMGRPYRAVTVYRKIKDVPHEVETLLAMPDSRYHREALVVSRHVKYPLGEARALAKLGKADEALAVLSKAGRELTNERGKLLLSLRRYREAAKAFEAVNNYLGLAQATELMDRDRARRFYEDASSGIKLDLKHTLVPRLRLAKKRLVDAPNSVALERARLYYSQCLGQVAVAYGEWSLSFAGSGDKSKAVKSARKALSFLRKQRERLEDGGGDAFGKKAVEALGVAKAIQGAEAALARCEALPN
ncbi:MAG: hypothetical protein JKY65_04690 [Planctomycetes bacterium]|nr:hypothetical protein [Planctomycetota bacterium]